MHTIKTGKDRLLELYFVFIDLFIHLFTFTHMHSRYISVLPSILMWAYLNIFSIWMCNVYFGHQPQTPHVTARLGFHLSEMDRLFVREDGCPMRCRCLGIADPYSKGAECSEISQDPSVQAGVGKRGNFGPSKRLGTRTGGDFVLRRHGARMSQDHWKAGWQ